jgi:hypothetical protein
MPHNIIVVTPAGRKHYLELLKDYILNDESVYEWHLWDNCRKQSDREYIQELERCHNKIKIIRIDNPDGTNRSVNLFYQFCKDPDTFYIKIDDDVVYVEKDCFRKLFEHALSTRDQHIWWSPLVINNAICSWLIKYHGNAEISDALSCQANDNIGWKSAKFASKIHHIFLDKIKNGEINDFKTNNFSISLSRFSINCIGFFGEDVIKYEQKFCPANTDDEEWISAVLPTITGRSGQVVGNIIVSHFAFFTQEYELLYEKLLEKYYSMTSKIVPAYELPKRNIKLRKKLKLWLNRIVKKDNR